MGFRVQGRTHLDPVLLYASGLYLGIRGCRAGARQVGTLGCEFRDAVAQLPKLGPLGAPQDRTWPDTQPPFWLKNVCVCVCGNL